MFWSQRETEEHGIVPIFFELIFEIIRKVIEKKKTALATQQSDIYPRLRQKKKGQNMSSRLFIFGDRKKQKNMKDQAGLLSKQSTFDEIVDI